MNSDLVRHIEQCSACQGELQARRAIADDMRTIAAESRQQLPDLDVLKSHVEPSIPGRAADFTGSGASRRVHLRRTLQIALPAAVALIVMVLIFSPFDRAERSGYEISVAGVNESLLTSGAINRLMAAIGLPEVEIEVGECRPGCSFRILGLKDLGETRLAIAALQKVPDAVIQSVDNFVDQQTGRKITRTYLSSKTGIDENRQWKLELGVDSSLDVRVSIALDSLKADSTFAWNEILDDGTRKSPGVQEQYTVHPDGSYSNSIFADPRARMAWHEHRWTFDSTGQLIAYDVFDTAGTRHEINFRNWADQEQQLRAISIFYMVTYDEDGTPYYAATNVDPTGLPGYGSTLPEGYFLNQNEPNPFDTLTRITFGLAEESPVTLEIYNSNSKLVRTLLDSTLSAGEHTMTWTGRDDEGDRVWSMRYLCKLQVGEFRHTIAMAQMWPDDSK